MSEHPNNIADVTASVGLVTMSWWWSAISGYGQLLLLVLGITVAALRAWVLIREIRREP